MAASYTLHIFWFGQTQLIEGESNKSVKSSELTTLPAYIAEIKSHRPNNIADSDLHAINTFEGIRADFLSKEKGKGFSVKFADIDPTVLSDLIAEIEAKP